MKDIQNLNTNNEHNEVQAAIDAGAAIGADALAMVGVRTIDEDGTRFLVSHNNVVLTSLEHLAAAPKRMRGTIAAETPLGFVEYVKRYRSGDTAIFIRRKDGDITAVFDYHSKGGSVAGGPVSAAKSGEHRAVFTAEHTPEWDRWIGANGVSMNQEAFAEFIEDNIGDIAEPDGAQLLELVENFKIKKDVNFTSHIKRSNGATKITYQEDVTGTAGGGALTGEIAIPEKIVLGIAIYEGGQKFRVEARFRYRLNGGKLALSFTILRLDDVLRSAFEEVVQGVQNILGQPGEQFYVEGTAPTTKQMWGT